MIALILVQVCDGGYGENVMKKLGDWVVPENRGTSRLSPYFPSLLTSFAQHGSIGYSNQSRPSPTLSFISVCDTISRRTSKLFKLSAFLEEATNDSPRRIPI
jgi:hypothetical protein